jgi:signal transduction histidine kinase
MDVGESAALAARGSVRVFIVLDRRSVLVAVAAVVAVQVLVVHEAAVFVIYPFLALHAVLLTLAARVLDRGALTAALAIVAGSNWFVAIAVIVMMPWLLGVMVLTVVMPLVLATPHVRDRELGVFLAVGALTLAAIGAIGVANAGGGIFEEIDGRVQLAVVVAGLVGHSIPLGLLVRQSNQSYRRAAEDAVRLQRQIGESRRRIVGAADAERSRIERDLHDGAQQHLVSVGLTLRRLATHHRRGSRIDAADLDAVVVEVDAAMTELRDLAHGLYPPLLEMRGLPAAVTAVTRRHAGPVQVEVGTTGRFDRQIESAVYFCCTESLQNITKHAPEATATIVVRHRPETGLVLTVQDDGPGFMPEILGAGRGLVNMADRVGSVGGTLEVASAPGLGTTVTALFPSAAPRPRTSEPAT